MIEGQDYKRLKTLLCHNQNASMFDIETLNEDILQADKCFTKRNEKLCNETK